jgi:hypothetical protein
MLADAELPSTFRAADATSLAGQRSAVRWRSAQLVLLLIAAVAGAFSWTIGDRFNVATLIAGGAFAAALICERARAATTPERAWYRGRAGAESVKTLAWKYAVAGEPFPAGSSRTDEVFLVSLEGVTRSLDEVDWTGGEEHPVQITPAMRKLRASPLAERMAAYRKARIADQRKWYASKAAKARRDARRWSMVVTIATSIGLAGAILKTFGMSGLDFLGIASACAAAGAAWTQFRQHDSLASAYGVAARELAFIDERLAICNDEATWAHLVKESEEAISREHTMWAARRDIRLSH